MQHLHLRYSYEDDVPKPAQKALQQVLELALIRMVGGPPERAEKL